MIQSLARLTIRSITRDCQDAMDYSRRLDSWSDEATGPLQLRLLQQVWDDCVKDVPYYGQLVEKGEAPRRIQRWKDFQAIPPLDRCVLQDQPQLFIRRSGSPSRIATTGGSTGQPIRIGMWRTEARGLRVAKLVPWVRLGYGPRSRLILIWGHAHLLGSGWRRQVNHAIRRAKDSLLGYTRIDAYTMDPEKRRRIIRLILKLRPCGIIGYAAVLDLLTRNAVEDYGSLREAGVRFVMPCAEPSPKADTFDLLRNVFRCPVIQEFGGVDFGHVAMKRNDDPFRVFPDLNIVEVDGLPAPHSGGQAALVTTLYKRYVPLVRYRQGDAITASRILDHGHVDQFGELIGRVNDNVILEDGTSVHSVAIAHCIKHEPRVLNIQMALRNSGLVVRLVVRESMDAAAEADIRHRLAQVHPMLRNASIEYVDDVATTRAGKRRWFSDERSTGSVSDRGTKCTT